MPAGFAAGFELEGFRFDAGSYVLLDRPGLKWAFRQMQIDHETQVSIQRIPDVNQVDDGSEHKVTIYDSFESIELAAVYDRSQTFDDLQIRNSAISTRDAAFAEM